jgi:hypothetical protein
MRYEALTASASRKKTIVQIENGLAVGNAGPLLGTAVPNSLNNLAGLDVAQPFVLELNQTGVTAELRRLLDVVLYVEYEATV